MAIYIAFLRGINVSGKNMIKMTELKRVFEELGLDRVQTYINSGNVLFESPMDEGALVQRMEQGIERAFGLSIKVVVRTDEELARIIAASPYLDELDPKGKNVNVGLLPETPSQERIDRLAPYAGGDQFQVIGRDIHLLFRQGTAESKLANNLNKLGVTVTVRNWNTMSKLNELAQARQI